MEEPLRLPRFFIVDGLPVKVVLEGDEVVGYISGEVSRRSEYPPLKAASEGREVSEEDFNAAVSALSASK